MSTQKYENSFGNPSHLPANYEHRPSRKDAEKRSASTGSVVGTFIVGALLGSAVGAATALFFAPKSGRELREEMNEQTEGIRMKSIELTAIAKEKANELTEAAKETADGFTRKFKNDEPLFPTDEGTVSEEDEMLEITPEK